MHICSCKPAAEPLNSGEVVRQVAAGASSMKEIVARTGAGTGCGGCGPSLSNAKRVVQQLATERDKATARGIAWPTNDEFRVADSLVSQAVLNRST